MKHRVLYILFLFFAASAFAQTKQTVTKSLISYQIKNMGIKTSGTIAGFEADILFDKDHLSTSSIEASVDTRTINSDNDMRDNHLKKEEYFDVEHYNKITMKSVSFRKKSESNYVGVFNVTIKNKTKLVEIPFTYIVNGKAGAFKGSFKIDRTDFAVGAESMVLSKEVTVFIDIETSA